MSCGQVRQYLDAWLDGELDAMTSEALAAHTRSCAHCTGLKAEREALIARVRAANPRFEVPARLRSAVHSLRAVPGARRLPLLRWWQAAALAVAASALSVALTLLWVGLPRPGADPANDELVARHVLSLAGPLVEVGSGDRHQIKPWFHGKIDFAPEVRDLTPLGYELQGARMERLAGATAVAVVYRIRNHPINLFVWRAAADGQPSLRVVRARGFTLARWSDQGLMFAAVSDVEPRDLERFAQAFAPVN